ncbi:MAG TPA: hypothetical protein VFK01_12030 [Bradyrhizobium sp.]|nr:hypothetical protein [Bradyrhizobium sp.]
MATFCSRSDAPDFIARRGCHEPDALVTSLAVPLAVTLLLR